MSQNLAGRKANANFHALRAYVTDLENEVERLRHLDDPLLSADEGNCDGIVAEPLRLPDTVEHESGVDIIALQAGYGSGHPSRLADLEDRLVRHLESCKVGVLADMGDTSSIGAGFLSVLLRCHRRAQRMDRRFALCGVNGLPELVMEFTRLGGVLDIYPSRSCALSGMSLASTARTPVTELRPGLV